MNQALQVRKPNAPGLGHPRGVTQHCNHVSIATTFTMTVRVCAAWLWGCFGVIAVHGGRYTRTPCLIVTGASPVAGDLGTGQARPLAKTERSIYELGPSTRPPPALAKLQPCTIAFSAWLFGAVTVRFCCRCAGSENTASGVTALLHSMFKAVSPHLSSSSTCTSIL